MNCKKTLSLSDFKIKIYTRSMNKTLYDRAISFVDLPYEKVKLQGTTADGYIVQLINDEEADIIINIDEDAFVCDIDKLKELLIYCIENEYVNCGMPDGGVIHLRKWNPVVTNPYFNILNVKELRKKIAEFKEEDFAESKESQMKDFPVELLKTNYEFVSYEPYYPLLIWMSQNFKTLYLNAHTHLDGISTVLHDQNDKPFIIHSWYSRYYNENWYHTQRINNVIDECGKLRNKPYPISFSDKCVSYIKIFIKICKKIVVRGIRRIGLIK